MEDVKKVAAYILKRYENEYGEKIDEMKLHKMLYFAQRESIIQTGKPLFESTFYGWKYGPVVKEIRAAFKDDTLESYFNDDFDDAFYLIMDNVFENYAGKTSWSLSRLTHGEISWQNSRKGISEQEKSDNPIKIEDIEKDAERIKARIKMLEDLGLM